jgi:hypothetical protein
MQGVVAFDVLAEVMYRHSSMQATFTPQAYALTSRPGLQLMTKHHYNAT